VASRRIRLLLGVAVVALALLAGRAAFITTVRGDDLSRQAARQQRATFELPAPRGTILSRDGQVLAVDRPTSLVSATPYLIHDRARYARELAPILGVRPQELEQRMSRRSGYEVLARYVDLDAADRIKTLGLPGIDLSDTRQRVYPGGRLAPQLLGLTDDDGRGLSGLELQLNRSLTGRPGLRREAHDPFGRPVRILANRDPVAGQAVRLTIDSTIQERTEQILAEIRKTHEAKSAMAVVMRPGDGAILALATVPRYDPNDRTRLDPALERERPVTDAFEPGSTYKLVTVGGALQEGLVGPSTVFDLPPTLTLYDRTLQEAHPRDEVQWTTSEILARSSNIGAVKIAQVLGRTGVQRWIERFGFGDRTGIDFPGEARGALRPLSQWYGTSILNIPIGQGNTVTLLQLARAYAAVANGGRLVRPYLVGRVGSRDTRPSRGRRIMSPATAQALNQMLRGVVSPDGTGALARVQGYEVAGKTGTANKIDPETGLYSETRYVSSFVGYAPANRPRLLVAVAVDEPVAGGIFGGEVAAPAFERIAGMALQRLEILPSRTP
jgi:cell division protein FtsI (penicillin-binding protein 3)